MAEEFDERMTNWVTSELQGVEVSLAAPGAQRTGRGVGMYLMEVMQSPPPSTNKRPPLQLTLRYLVTAWSDKQEDAHQILVQLIFAAMENKDFQVGLESIPLSVWTAFGTVPQPSFVLSVPLRRERSEPDTKLVREPLKVQAAPMMSFHGLLLGPGDLPLSDCRVEVPSLRLYTSTDHKGRFCFPGIPAIGTKKLLIKAKGRELPFDSEENYPDSGTPLVIHFSPLEE
jgi:Pvc16 N-terminal domain